MISSPRLAMDERPHRSNADLLLGEDWVSPESVPEGLRAARLRGGFISLNRSPLARKIIIFNLLSLMILVAGILFINPFRHSLVLQREDSITRETQLMAEGLAARWSPQSMQPAEILRQLPLSPGVEVFVLNPAGEILASRIGPELGALAALQGNPTVITDFLNGVWNVVSLVLSVGGQDLPRYDAVQLAQSLLAKGLEGRVVAQTGVDHRGGAVFTVAAPVLQDGEVTAVLVQTSAAGEIDQLVRYEREQILQIFVVALMVSIGLSLLLASTIANPLSDLAAAAETGRDRDGSKVAPGRVRIPDLTARPDEIGRLSVAMRGMVSALYDRIDANEQFAADVAHEIKNPLASLRSAVGSLRFVKKDEHRVRLLDVIEHDVRRLDRLVSDISNASRLDSELVKEEEEEFNLVKTLANLTQYLGEQAREKGVDFITDLPTEPLAFHGLEARLAQVFVNLVSNAISFCDEGDAVRVWARKRDNRVLVVVEDTGPGIPEQALTKVFKRFYSDRPATHFGNNSGLGLAISKQIVEAHGGVIWAENIHAPGAEPQAPPLGARFVVGLPV